MIRQMERYPVEEVAGTHGAGERSADHPPHELRDERFVDSSAKLIITSARGQSHPVVRLRLKKTTRKSGSSSMFEGAI